MNEMVKKRRWLTLSIRSLILLMIVSAIVIAVIANRDHKIRSAVWKIQPYGGHVSWNENGPAFLTKMIGRDVFATPEEIVFIDEPLPDEALELLKGLEGAERITIAQNETFTGQGLQHLAKFRNLKRLYVYDVPVTDEGLRHLPELKSLEELMLYATKLTAESFPELAKHGHASTVAVGSGNFGQDDLEKLNQILPDSKVTISRQPFSGTRRQN